MLYEQGLKEADLNRAIGQQNGLKGLKEARTKFISAEEVEVSEEKD